MHREAPLLRCRAERFDLDQRAAAGWRLCWASSRHRLRMSAVARTCRTRASVALPFAGSAAFTIAERDAGLLLPRQSLVAVGGADDAGHGGSYSARASIA